MTWRTTVPAVLVLAFLALAMGCSDTIGPHGAPAAGLAGLIVSQPLSPLSGGAQRGAGLSAAPSSGGVVYVSMVPGTVPEGIQATIQDPATGASVTTAVLNGGFDPVTLWASVGDTLVVMITRPGVDPVRAVVLVRPSRPPVIVRTSPPNGGPDVPLNARMLIVFSEPIEATTLTTGAVQLWRGATPVTGTVRFSDSVGVKAEFAPAGLLAALTDYRLVVTRAILDVEGLPLDSEIEVRFTTGSTLQVAAKLVFLVQPTDASTAGTISPAVTVAIQDPSGGLVTSASGAVSIALGVNPVSGTLSGTTTVNAVDGLATFGTLSIDKAGSGYTLVASSTSAASATSAPFAVTSDSRTVGLHLTFVAQPTNTLAGETINPAIQVAVSDLNNIVTSGVHTITVSIDTTVPLISSHFLIHPALSGTRTVAAVNGIATFSDLHIDQATYGPGQYRLVASAPWLDGVQSAPFSVAPRQAAALVFLNQPLSAIAGQLLPAPIYVSALDSLGNEAPVPGTVTATLGTNSAGGSLIGTTSGAQYYTSTVFDSLGVDRPGTYSIVASASGLRSATSAPFAVWPAIGPATSLIAFDDGGGLSVWEVNAGGIARLAPGWQPDWSPDGSKLAFGCGNAICVMQADGSGVTRVVGGQGGDSVWAPVWSFDGAHIAFVGSISGTQAIWIIDADGSALRELIPIVAYADHSNSVSWSPDGRSVAFSADYGDSPSIYVINVDGSGLRRLARYGGSPAWSPDGTRIAYVGGDVFIANADGSGTPTRLSVINSPSHVAWSPDGTRIAYDANCDGYDGGCGSTIYVMTVGGTLITETPADLVARWPAWRR